MKPLQQLFGLAVEKIWEYQKKMGALKTFKKDMEKLAEKYNIRQWIVIYSELVDINIEEWRSTSNVVSQEMIDHIEDHTIPWIKEIFEDENIRQQYLKEYEISY